MIHILLLNFIIKKFLHKFKTLLYYHFIITEKIKNMIKKIISNIIKEAVNNYLKNQNINNDINIENIEIAYSVDDKFGDYACPVGMRLAKILKKNPMEIAEGKKQYRK